MVAKTKAIVSLQQYLTLSLPETAIFVPRVGLKTQYYVIINDVIHSTSDPDNPSSRIIEAQICKGLLYNKILCIRYVFASELLHAAAS